MMREIKFRAWFKNENEIKKVAISNVYDGNNTHLYLSPMPASDYKPIELMQYTELKDKKGVGIYEGDIVDFTIFDHHDNGTNYKGVVKYRSGIYEIWKNNDSEFFESDGPFILNFVWLQDDEFEVIGNIFENRELLEEKTHDR